MANERVSALGTQIYSEEVTSFGDRDSNSLGSRKISPFDSAGQFRNSLTPRGGVVLDGTSSFKFYSTLTGQSFGTDPWSVSVIFKVPSAISTSLGVWGIGPSNADFSSSGSPNVSVGLEPGSGGRLVITKGRSNGVYIGVGVNNVGTNYAGKVIHLVVTHDGSSSAPLVYINGVLTATVSVYAAGAAWSDSITSTYFGLGYQVAGSSTHLAGSPFNAATVYNLVLTASDVLEIYELDGAVPERYKFGSQTNFMSGNDSNFSGAGNWSANGTAVATVTGGQLVVTGITNSGTNNLVAPTWAQSTLAAKTSNRRYRLILDVASLNLGGASAAIDIYCSVVSNSTPIGSILVTGNAQVFDFDYVSGGSNGSAMLNFNRRGTSGQCDITLDNVILKTIGAVVHFPLDDGYSYLLKDQSSNKLHMVMSTSGGSHVLSQNRPHHIRGTTNTSGNQQLWGQALIPANSRILSIRARAQSGTPVIKVGTSSGASDLAAKFTLSTSWQQIPDVLFGNGSNNFSTLTAAARTNGDVSITGAEVGDVVTVVRNDGSPWPQGLSVESTVPVADTARIYLTNNTAGNVTVNTVGFIAAVYKNKTKVLTTDTSIWINSSTADVVEIDITVEPLSA